MSYFIFDGSGHEAEWDYADTLDEARQIASRMIAEGFDEPTIYAFIEPGERWDAGEILGTTDSGRATDELVKRQKWEADPRRPYMEAKLKEMVKDACFIIFSGSTS